MYRPLLVWKNAFVAAESLHYDVFDRRYVVTESLMPQFTVRIPRSQSQGGDPVADPRSARPAETTNITRAR